MKLIVTGVALLAGLALAAPAAGAPGQCRMTGYDEFACDVSVDGGGLAFSLPDGQWLVFSHRANGEGEGYLISAEADPGDRPDELGSFVPVENEPGCWFGAKEDITFCAAIEQ